MRLHHVNVVVPPGQTESVTGFYALLGLTRVEKPAEGVAREGAWFDFPGGTTQVHVSERVGDRNADQHFAISVGDLDGLVAALTAAGHTCTPGSVVLGARRFNTADPVGNKVELIEAVGPFA
jgi:catechol 2,3-dioxygenase-like lactoylglutathione lyase family enzyme